MYIVNSLGATEFGPSTTVSRVTMAKSPYNQVSTQYLAPSPTYGLKQFLQMKTQSVHFRGTFIGSMVDVGELDVTSTGQPKRSFVLVDDMGAWFPCCAVGRLAHILQYPINMKVVLYFGTARMNPQGDGFILYAFRDSAIVPLQQQASAPMKRTDVSVRVAKS